MVFLGIILVVTPPSVSTPKDNGVTSRSKISLTSPANTPACTAAPTATTSSGLTVWLGFLPKTLVTTSCTAGILVDPPTKTTSSILLLSNFASFKAFSTGILALSISEEHNSSNLFLVIDLSRCLGPVSVAVKTVP